MTVRSAVPLTLALALATVLVSALATTSTLMGAWAQAAGATPTTGSPAAGAAPAVASVEHRQAPARTRLRFTVRDCEGCRVQLDQARRAPAGDVRAWASRPREVTDGTVTFSIPTRRTHGMSATVRAPWEGQTGYVTTVAWRYGGKQPGDPVTLSEAVTKRWASACWEGVRRRQVTIALVVEEVEVDGVHGRVPGSIAFVPSTQSWLSPMRRAYQGVLGSQDVNICR